jgi:TonB family protein
MSLRGFWPSLLLISVSSLCWGSIASATPRKNELSPSLAAREQQVWRAAVHDSEFATVPHVAARANCEATRQPEALATPNPLLVYPDQGIRVSVSFIIGTDGRVHSPLILESAEPAEDDTVLKVIRSWRYRPATCNGVPTEAEAKIEFSSR